MIRPKQIIRSNRKSVALIINNHAELIIRAPLFMSNDYIDKFVKSKQNWIVQKQNLIKTNNEKHIQNYYIDGESVLYMGKYYILEFADIEKIELTQEKMLIPKQYEERAKGEILDWYKEKAYNKLKDRLDYYAHKIAEKYSRFSLSKAHTRWGSCGAKQSINLNWRLIMCPQFVIDYVVIHELSHLRFKNHRKCFWNRVYTIMPDYKKAEAWLKENSGLLKIEK